MLGVAEEDEAPPGVAGGVLAEAGDGEVTGEVTGDLRAAGGAGAVEAAEPAAGVITAARSTPSGRAAVPIA